MLCVIFPLVPTSPPANLTAYNTSSTSIRVSWDPVPKPFRQGFILGYRVYLIGTHGQPEQNLRRRKRTSTPTGNEIFMDTANLTTEFQGLEKYSNYCVQAVAYTRVGESNRTNVTCAFTDEDGEYSQDYSLIPFRSLQTVAHEWVTSKQSDWLFPSVQKACQREGYRFSSKLPLCVLMNLGV